MTPEPQRESCSPSLASVVRFAPSPNGQMHLGHAPSAPPKKLNGAPLTLTEFDADGAAHMRPAEPERWGDAVIVRKEFPVSYTLAIVIDDAARGVSHVTRGQDLLAATELQRIL